MKEFKILMLVLAFAATGAIFVACGDDDDDDKNKDGDDNGDTSDEGDDGDTGDGDDGDTGGGDDGDTGGGDDGDTGGGDDGDTGGGDDGDTGGDATEDLFAAFNCNISDAVSDPCGFSLCSLKLIYDSTQAACTDGTFGSALCKDFLDCFKDDVIACFEKSCPPGTAADAVTEEMTDAMQSCADASETCTSSLTGK